MEGVVAEHSGNKDYDGSLILRVNLPCLLEGEGAGVVVVGVVGDVVVDVVVVDCGVVVWGGASH